MTCPRLKRVKGSLAMTMLNDKIFAIGEGVGSAVFSEDEMFDPALGRWMNSLSTQQNQESGTRYRLRKLQSLPPPGISDSSTSQ